jgi:hypothetical protein
MYGYTYGYPSGGGAGAVNGFESAVLSDGGTVVAIGNTTDLYSRLLGLGLINSASLVNSCNGGKADALYNFIPSPVQSLDRFTVTRASTKLRIGSNGLYGSVANNVPAFEFNTDGTYRGLLVEPGATNLALQSQAFQTTWTASDATVSADATTAPDGATTADKIVVDATNAFHQVSQVITLADSLTYTFSVFAKKAELNWLSFACTNKAGVDYLVWFNLDTGVVGTVGAGATARISLSGNGYYRCEMSYPSQTGGATTRQRIRANSADNQFAWLGDGTSVIFIWQAQLETGSVATSPIATTAGTASRVADSVTLASASSLIGQPSGSMFCEFEFRNTGGLTRVFGLSTGTADTNNAFRLNKGATGTLSYTGTTASASQFTITSGATYVGQIIKVGVAYATDDVAFYAQGVQIGTDATSTTPAFNTVTLGITEDGLVQLNGWIRSVALFPTRLANATLQSLTT